MKKYSIGVDIGGTKCAVLLGKGSIPAQADDGFILEKKSFLTQPEKGLQDTLDRLYAAVDALLLERKVDADQVTGIGISCGGPLDHEQGIVLNPPNLYGWDSVPIVDLLQERYGIPARLQNDANACALAEWRFGAARGCRNVIFLTFGTGMGAGLILDGRLYNGVSNMAGEVGHIRLEPNGPVGYGKAGSFEGFCSGGGLIQLARSIAVEKLQQGQPPLFCPDFAALNSLNAKNVAEAAEKGDPVAAEVYRVCGENLGKGLAVLVDLLNPEIIVIGSIFARSRELLWPHARAVLRREALMRSLEACRVVPSALGEHLGDYAALSVAFAQ